MRRCSRIEPRCSPPEPPNAASLATTSVVVMVGDVCAVSGGQTASFAIDIDLWRSSQKRYQRACERGSAEAMREGKVCREGVLKVAEPSSELRRAMGRRLTGADDGKSHPQAPRSLSRPPGWCPWRTLKSAELHHVGGNVQNTRFSICEGIDATAR